MNDFCKTQQEKFRTSNERFSKWMNFFMSDEWFLKWEIFQRVKRNFDWSTERERYDLQWVTSNEAQVKPLLLGKNSSIYLERTHLPVIFLFSERNFSGEKSKYHVLWDPFLLWLGNLFSEAPNCKLLSTQAVYKTNVTEKYMRTGLSYRPYS